jgi:GNAT superfamily N-acetyltransferase
MEKENIILRPAEENDTGILLDFIKKLASYEKKTDEVIATESDLECVLFRMKIAEAIIAELDGEAAGFAIFFYNFSTFIGKPGIYIEDLFVNPEVRGKGIGKALLSYIARLAIKRKCCRLEWSVLHWNEPSINFYKKLGAEPKDEWVGYKLSGKSLKKIADMRVWD